jgi:uncharacterized membrane protein YozB (DUF420 family)
MSLNELPHLNAILNGITFLLILAAYYKIRRNDRSAHRKLMISGFAVACLFLVSYLIYHYGEGSKRFLQEGWIRPVYFTILLSHTILAALVVPLILVALFRALRNNFAGHKKIARWTFPIWLYVSLTGVLIYLMLYQM